MLSVWNSQKFNLSFGKEVNIKCPVVAKASVCLDMPLISNSALAQGILMHVRNTLCPVSHYPTMDP